MQERAHPREQRHPGPAEYVRIAVVLAVITVVEVAIYYIEALSGMLVPILLVLSALKFALVALWFMHLKFDSRLFSAIFTVPLAVAAAVFIALLALFQRLFT